MNTVRVSLKNEYDVIIERKSSKKVGDYALKIINPCRVLIVADERVFSLYGKTVVTSFEKAGFKPEIFTHKSGENSKSAETYLEILNFAAENRFSKTDLFVALGGGVTGDLTGFAAATYLRGVKYITMPTTLLAAVDASVGGKTAINLKSGKNSAGVIYQPSAVICDLDLLKTLDERDYRSGCAEVIKYAIIKDKELFSLLENNDIKDIEEEVITRSVKIKRDIVEKDEFDGSLRQILNFGHTVGHAAEKCSGYTLTHGEAVAVGMAAMLRAAAKSGVLQASVCDRALALIEKNSLPVSCDIPPEKLYMAAMSDKKIRNGKINLIIPDDIGSCRIVPSDFEELKRVIYYE